MHLGGNACMLGSRHAALLRQLEESAHFVRRGAWPDNSVGNRSLW